MILGGKLPGKVGRCRFFIARKANTTVNIAPFRESTVSHDHNGVAAGEETVKLAVDPARYMDVAGFFIAKKRHLFLFVKLYVKSLIVVTRETFLFSLILVIAKLQLRRVKKHILHCYYLLFILN